MSPFLIAGVGTLPINGLVVRSRKISKVERKNNLFFRIGPAKVNPYSLRRNGFFAPTWFQIFASRALFRKNSNTVAWYALVPDRVAIRIWVGSRPYSAGKPPVNTLNSNSASIEG